MARVILVTGGCRSGKSDHAQKLAESLPPRRAYVATAPILDDEMRHRVAKHQGARAAEQWDTFEEPVDLAGALHRASGHNVVLVDCLTLWINNLMYQAELAGKAVHEEDVAAASANVLAACRRHAGTVIFVTNEVGMGIVPDNPLARRYRDLVGRCNQTLAAGADQVTLVACGIALQLKG